MGIRRVSTAGRCTSLAHDVVVVLEDSFAGMCACRFPSSKVDGDEKVNNFVEEVIAFTSSVLSFPAMTYEKDDPSTVQLQYVVNEGAIRNLHDRRSIPQE